MLLYFGQVHPVDIAIIEAGIGGLLDSTNVLTPLALVCPSISYDHQETLGNNLTDIARHKIGALKKEVPFIFASSDREVREIFYQQAQLLNSPTYELGNDFFIKECTNGITFWNKIINITNLHLAMLGKHQSYNAALAIQTSLILQKQFKQLDNVTIQKGIEKAKLPGRTELILPYLLLDGAHNIDAILKLKTVLNTYFQDKL